MTDALRYISNITKHDNDNCRNHYPPETKPSITKKLENQKHELKWCPQLLTTHYIEQSGLQRSTKSIKEEVDRWTVKRNRETKRTKRHRNQVIDIMVSMCQLDARNNNTFPICPNPTKLFKIR